MNKMSLKDIGYLRAKDAAEYLGVARSTFSNLTKQKDFPKPIRLSETLVLYKRAELDEWIEKRRQKWN